MIAEELINHDIPLLKSSDKVKLALEWLTEYKLDHLVVSDDGEYKGLIGENTLLDIESVNTLLSKVNLEHSSIFVRDKNHILEVLAFGKKYSISLVPVVGEGDKYLGAINLQNFYQVFSDISDVTTPGGIIVISIDRNDFILSQISRLVESHTAKILMLYTSVDVEDPLKLDLTLKINKTDISAIIATLERYSFNIVAYYQESEIVSKDKDRLDLLLKYINL